MILKPTSSGFTLAVSTDRESADTGPADEKQHGTAESNEQHGPVTQVSFTRPVLPGWRAAALRDPHRAGSDPLPPPKPAAGTRGPTVPRSPPRGGTA